MRLDELLTTVAESTAEDWEKLDVHTVYVWDCAREDECQILQPTFHHGLAVFKPDVDVSLAFGATVNSPLEEPWVERFPDRAASTIAVWLRYRGAMVFEWVVARVDGGRYVLPLPGVRNGIYVVLRENLPMARLFFNLMSTARNDEGLDATLARAGIPIVNRVARNGRRYREQAN